MARTNIKQKTDRYTHEGGPAKRISPIQELRRSVLACLLWESSFYEDGEAIGDRIKYLVPQCEPQAVADLAIEARSEYRLRHAPLLLVYELTRHPSAKGKLIGDTVAKIIQRADELTEFLAIYWKEGKRPLSAQTKKGIAEAFTKFDAYQLAKYDRDNVVRLRDALFMCHPKPKNKVQERHWKQLIEGTLPAPDTWETNLSAGADKKDTFERLLHENKLGYMALLRNLRNMRDASVSKHLVAEHLIGKATKGKALPFRFVSAAKAVPQWEDIIDQAMRASLAAQKRLNGKTIVLVDVSYSMVGARLSTRSDLDRLDAAAALAALVAGIAEEFEIFCFTNDLYQLPPRQGMALVDAIRRTPHGGTYLGAAVSAMNQREHDRLIVITDEQSADRVPDPVGCGYMINVASYQNGVGYGKWTHIDGFSEAVIAWIQEMEG